MANKVYMGEVMMRMRRFLAICWVFGVIALAQSQPEGSHLNMGVGSQRVLSISGAVRVAAGSPDVLEVKVVPPNQLLLTALAEGRTTLTVWRNNGQRQAYTVTVRKVDQSIVVTDIKKLLGDIEGINVRIIGDFVYIDGQAYTQADADRVDQVVAIYPNVKSLVKISPNAKRLVAQNLDAAFQKAGLKNIRANVVGATVFLEGSVESQQDLEKVQLITKALGEQVESLLTVGIRRMVLSEVQFVEVRRNTLDRYGLKLPTDLVGDVSSSFSMSKGLFSSSTPFEGGFGASGGLDSGWSFGLQDNTGYGRLLAQPKLVCASGETAEFLAGGEVPLPLVSMSSMMVQFKPYGVMLKIKPTADRSGNIETEIEAEVSEIDNSVSVSLGGGVSMPGFRNRRVRTNVTVRHGETIVLSGVFNHDEQKSVSKFPGLGHIPIIGELFKNRGFDTTKRELLIFVTPRIVNPESDKIREMIDDMKVRYKQARSDVRFDIFD
ncbi:MAG: pilus assembly protein N-terminal domain-containing protein [Cystobacterineae bacterium]|nr:pilus assembly protein N-terminal domain-containing protein [Cystobacterineae bacterium]